MTTTASQQRPQPLGLISLIVATYGRSAELQTLFESLSLQTDRAFEIIVVDQNADRRLEPVLVNAKSKGLDVRHVQLSEPNLSLARNVGLEHARGRVVGYPDDDCWYEPGVIATVRAVFDGGGDIDGVVGRWAEKQPASSREPYRLNSEAWRRFRGGDAPSLSLFIKTERVRSLGGFDVRLGTGRWFGASEDTDLVLRLLAAGERVEYTPDAVIHHPFFAAPPLTKSQLRRARSYGRGIGALYSKHGLPVWVRVRGILAPFWSALQMPKPHHAFLLAAATATGRLEGAVRWSLQHGRWSSTAGQPERAIS